MKKTNKKKLEEFIRVDHAGERGAIKIYEGQLLALKTFKNDPELLKSFDDISVSCKDVSFKLLGLSLATINFLLSVIIIIFGLVIFNYEKNR